MSCWLDIYCENKKVSVICYKSKPVCIRCQKAKHLPNISGCVVILKGQVCLFMRITGHFVYESAPWGGEGRCPNGWTLKIQKRKLSGISSGIPLKRIQNIAHGMLHRISWATHTCTAHGNDILPARHFSSRQKGWADETVLQDAQDAKDRCHKRATTACNLWRYCRNKDNICLSIFRLAQTFIDGTFKFRRNLS